MFNQRQLVAWGLAIVLMFASVGYAQADDANQHVAELRVDLRIADGVNISATDDSDVSATADARSDQTDVIEEIVVFGKKKWQLPNPDRSFGTGPVVQKPGRIDWQFLPKYDPERVYPHIYQLQRNEEIRRVGFIELFRARFGR